MFHVVYFCSESFTRVSGRITYDHYMLTHRTSQTLSEWFVVLNEVISMLILHLLCNVLVDAQFHFIKGLLKQLRHVLVKPVQKKKNLFWTARNSSHTVCTFPAH